MDSLDSRVNPMSSPYMVAAKSIEKPRTTEVSPPTPPFSPPARALWKRHLELRDAIVVAEGSGQFREVRALEEELRKLKARIFARYRKRSLPQARVSDPFRYRIPIVEQGSGKMIGYLVADEKGVHRPRELQSPLPPNFPRREWLKVFPPSKLARHKAALTWKALGHSGRPQCPGCRRRSDLVYLEFRNWDEADRWKISHALAVCDQTAVKLLRRARSHIFGVTAVGRRIPWTCANQQASILPLAASTADLPASRGPGRGGWRGRQASLDALRRLRESRTREKAHSLSLKPA